MAYRIGFVLGRIVFLLILAFAIMTLVKTKDRWNNRRLWKLFRILIGFFLLIQVTTTSIRYVQLLMVLTMLFTTVVFNIKSKRISKN